MGVAVIITAVAAGCIARYACNRRVVALRDWQFLALGLVVHLLCLAWFVFLPLDYVNDVLLVRAPVNVPLLTLATLATLAMSVVLRELNAMRNYEQSLLESRSRIRYLFENAAVALYEEDFSDLLAALEALRASGVDDIRRYLTEWPDEVERLAALIRVIQVNPAAVDAIIVVPIPQTREAAQHVAVSLVDMTAVRVSERELEQQKQRLEEVVGGTGAGTWEWNIATGETVQNERWAEIVGYTLEDLQPTSLETWIRLYHPEDRERSNHQLSRVFAREVSEYECDVRLRHRSGACTVDLPGLSTMRSRYC